MRARRRFSAFGLVLAATTMAAWAARADGDVTLPVVFGDHMVLQRDMPLPVWGHANPGERVTVRFNGKDQGATADADGKWKVVLEPAPASAAPAELVVAGNNRIELKDVLVGEVWVCSGQSNMEKPLGEQKGQRPTENAPQEIAAADFPQIRLLQIPKSGDPAEVAKARWADCTPANVDGLHFSAVGYFFARKLYKELNVPIGMIHTSWGGTRIEPWTPPEGFDEVESLHRLAESARHRGPTTRGANTAPSGLWNAMVEPLVPFAIRGAIWYQGESNVMTHDRMAYLDKMRALIGGWRHDWGEGDFPFYFVQLAPFDYSKRPREHSSKDELPAVWEAQLQAMETIPNTGMVVITDLVDNVKDIHPTRKREVGERLALWALAKTYGKSDVVCSGPIYKSADFGEGRAVIHFDSVGGGLESRDGKPLTGFTIAGADQNFVPAEAQVEGQTVVVSSPKVPEPKAVRFGWDEVAMPNLANKDGRLPASPFRTDAWELPPSLPPEPATRSTTAR